MFQAKTTRFGLSLVLTLVLSFASSAVALAAQKPASRHPAVRPPATWIAVVTDLLLAKVGGRIDENGYKVGGRIDENGLLLRFAACIEREDGAAPCDAEGGR
jgi:hypothetical protein